MPDTNTTIDIGDTVIARMAENAVTYGGPDKHGSAFTMVIGRGVNSITVLCPPTSVAPADTPLADAKDPRIKVVKRATFSGNWWLDLPDLPGSPHKTKKAAVNEGQRMLAIADWHAANPA